MIPPVASIDSLLTAAKGYQDRGFKVVPLNGKNPGLKGWPVETYTLGDIDFHLRKYGNTEPGIGVQMGPFSRLVDFEWDSPEEFQVLKDLFDGDIPDGPEFKSKRGGHKLFAWDDRLHLTRYASLGVKGDTGVELVVRLGAVGLGSQSAFPPTRGREWLPGKSLDAIGLPKLPATVVEKLITEAARKPRAEVVADDVPIFTASAERIEEIWRDHLLPLEDAVSGNYGHNKFYKACCAILRAGVNDDEQGLALAHRFNDEKCFPPFSDDDVERKWEQAKRNQPVIHPSLEFDELPDAEASKPAPKSPPYRKPPVDVLPKPCSEFVKKVAAAIGCDEAFVLLPLLGVLFGAIGNSRVLQLKRGWLAPAIAWLVPVGDSGTGKSPSQYEAARPLRDHQRKEQRIHAALVEKREAELRESKEKANTTEGDKPVATPAGKLTPVPTQKRWIVSDITVEALAEKLRDNPRGLTVIRDELNGWFGSFDRYAQKGGGSDESQWLSMYNGGEIIVDRKTGSQRTISVARAAVSIIGGIQPGILRNALNSDRRESGLAARFLFAYPPRQPKVWRESEIDPGVTEPYAAVVNRLLDLEPDADITGATPRVLTLTPDAKAKFVEYYERHAKEQAALGGELSAAWSKLEETAARLAMAIHLAKWASIPAVDAVAAADAELFDGPAIPTPVDSTVDAEVVDADSMEAGIKLAEWFKGEAVRIYALLRESDGDAERRRLLEWIDGRGGSVTARDVYTGCRWLREAGKADAALDELVRHGHGLWVLSPSGGRGKPTRRFTIRPDVVSVNTTKPEENGLSLTADTLTEKCSHD